LSIIDGLAATSIFDATMPVAGDCMQRSISSSQSGSATASLFNNAMNSPEARAMA